MTKQELLNLIDRRAFNAQDIAENAVTEWAQAKYLGMAQELRALRDIIEERLED